MDEINLWSKHFLNNLLLNGSYFFFCEVEVLTIYTIVLRTVP